MVWRWMGTRFLYARCSRSSSPMRSSSQRQSGPCALTGPTSGALAHHDLVSAHVHDEAVERARGRALDVLAVQIVVPVVAGAPDMAHVGTVLHGAVEVRAHRGEGAQLAGRRPHEDPRAAAELEDLPRVGLHVVGLEGK